MLDIQIQNGTVFIFKNGSFHRENLSVGLKDGKIVELSHQDSNSTTNQSREAHRIVDAKGLFVCPGMIDSQVHFREPGLTHKEDLESGTRGAALGGITSVFEMPNTNPSTTTADLFDDKIKRAQNRAWVNFAFYIGASSENIANLADLEKRPGCAGIKVFMGSSTGSLLIDTDEELERVLKSGSRRVIVHSEDEARLKERKHLAIDSQDVKQHPHWRDAESALKSTKRLIALAEKLGRPVHVLHVSTAEELEFLANHKKIATVEVLPQHLTLSAPDCYERLGTKAQMNPPIREQRHQDALWKALKSGVVDVLGSDHAPHTLEEKNRPYPTSPSGMPMVQTLVPIMLNHINAGRLSMEEFLMLVTENPRRIFGCQTKGRIAIGLDADLTLVDPKKEFEITNSWIASKSAWSPFAGMKVKGMPTMTIVGGKIIMENQVLAKQPNGSLVSFS